MEEEIECEVRRRRKKNQFMNFRICLFIYEMKKEKKKKSSFHRLIYIRECVCDVRVWNGLIQTS